MPDLSTLTGAELVQELLQAGGGTFDGLEDYQGNDVTDLIVDSGSNSDGYWWRIAPNIQVCANIVNESTSMSTSSGSSQEFGPYDYPKSFDSVWTLDMDAIGYRSAWGRVFWTETYKGWQSGVDSDRNYDTWQEIRVIMRDVTGGSSPSELNTVRVIMWAIGTF